MKALLRIIALFVFSISLIGYSYAGEQEEYECFKILHKYTKDYTYEGEKLYKDMENIIIDNEVKDLSDYKTFKKNRITKSDGSHFFKAKRNNIGTIKTKQNYLVTQVVTFGSELNNMEFPLQTRDLGILTKSEGEPYTKFSQNLIYTHHLISSGSLLSCAYLKITPVQKGDYDSINTDIWFTNGLIEEGGSFEILHELDTVDEILGTNSGSQNKFLVGKSRVPALDSNGNPLFTMDIVTVAYDNHSKFLNESQTFPLQVDVMTNIDKAVLKDYSAQKLSEDFLKEVNDKTCLKIPHGSPINLPKECKFKYRPYFPEQKLSKHSVFDNLFSYFVPMTAAAIPEEEMTQEIGTGVLDEEKDTSGSVVKGVIPLGLVQKLRQVPDEDFQNFILASVADSTQRFLNSHSGSIGYRDYAKVFSECGISFKEREEIVLDYLTKLNPEEWNVNNLTYSNPRFGDCIIPYPDKRNIKKVIPGSFKINQERAKIMKEVVGSADNFVPKPSNYSAKQIQSMQAIDTIRFTYNERISNLNKEYNKGRISEGEYKKMLDNLVQERDKKVSDLMNVDKSLSLSLIVGIVLFITGIVILLFLLRRK